MNWFILMFFNAHLMDQNHFFLPVFLSLFVRLLVVKITQKVADEFLSVFLTGRLWYFEQLIVVDSGLF